MLTSINALSANMNDEESYFNEHQQILIKYIAHCSSC